jgi:hypothetical protein
MSVGIEEHKDLRQAASANILLQSTLMWVANLPPDIQPTALMRRFPRIANLVAATWGDPKFLDTYIEALLTYSRGTHRGFPPDLLPQLVALQRYRRTLRDESLALDSVSKRG